MLFSRLMPLASVFVATASAGSSHDGSKKHFHGFKKVPILCEGLKTEDNGCTRYTQGFDVTGVVTTLELLFPEVKNVCDCIQECLNRPGTCANYIWDFHDADAIKNGNRTCVLYSNFNLPSNVTVVFAPNDTQNVNIQELENNPQARVAAGEWSCPVLRMQEATGLTGKARPCPERMIVRRDSSTLNPYTPAQAETHQPSPIVDPAYGTLASEVRGDGPSKRPRAQSTIGI
ncbi:hypothetical protein EHS25_000650 [Saitozyma podzolica]|uniref:Apple domain-containing protein n=1 Tax=Saitozyma podzolica TaxID=1890683 RepID=A0A427YWP3_9TREE|nr:hypothetical protein EHS25_000650 [Saitozyma podzolica]